MLHAPQIVQKVFDLLLYLIPQVAKFPRSERILLLSGNFSKALPTYALLSCMIFKSNPLFFDHGRGGTHDF